MAGGLAFVSYVERMSIPIAAELMMPVMTNAHSKVKAAFIEPMVLLPRKDCLTAPIGYTKSS